MTVGRVIKNAVIHLLNEQPLLADLYEMPKALDQGLLCTNLRMMDGKRPVFVDRIESIFFFPYLHVRFLEILPLDRAGVAEIEARGRGGRAAAAAEAEAGRGPRARRGLPPPHPRGLTTRRHRPVARSCQDDATHGPDNPAVSSG